MQISDCIDIVTAFVHVPISGGGGELLSPPPPPPPKKMEGKESEEEREIEGERGRERGESM